MQDVWRIIEGLKTGLLILLFAVVPLFAVLKKKESRNKATTAKKEKEEIRKDTELRQEFYRTQIKVNKRTLDEK